MIIKFWEYCLSIMLASILCYYSIIYHNILCFALFIAVCQKDEILGKSKSKEKDDMSELVEHVEKQLSLHKLLMESSEAKRKLAKTPTELFRFVHQLPKIKGQPSCYPPCEVKP